MPAIYRTARALYEAMLHNISVCGTLVALLHARRTIAAASSAAFARLLKLSDIPASPPIRGDQVAGPSTVASAPEAAAGGGGNG